MAMIIITFVLICIIKNKIYDFCNSWANFNIIIKQLRLIIIAWLYVVEYMWKKYCFELIEMKGFGNVKQNFVGIAFWKVFGYFMQDLIRFICKAWFTKLSIKFAVTSICWFISTYLSYCRMYLHSYCEYIINKSK